MSSISIKKATMINAIAKYSTVIINLIFTAVLARILTPEDYGVVAIVVIFTAFFSVLCDMGLGVSIIQNKELTDRDISSIFGFSMHIAVILAIAFCVLSIPISIFYNNCVYRSICCILSLSIIFDTLNMVPNAILMKEKKFVLVGTRMIVINIVTGILTIIMAESGAKYYALVFQSVIASFATFIWNYNSTKPKLALKYDKTSIEKIKSYSGFQFAFNIVNYFARNLDNLLIGKFMGPSELAFYNKGYTLMLYPINYLTFVITPVIHPILSDYKDNIEYIYKQYVKVVKILSLIGVFITAFCFSTSKEIILIIFGNQWNNSITCFKILSLSIIFQMTVSSAGSIYLSLGNTKMMFKSGIVFTIEMVICILIGVSTGDINKVAFFVTISLIIKFFIDYYFLISKSFGYSVIKFYRNFMPDFCNLLVLLVILKFSNYFIINNLLLSALYKFVICAIVYLFELYITKQYKYIFMLLPLKNKQKFS